MSLPIACHNDLFGTAGQITPEQLSEVVALGYKSVINNRPDLEGGAEQPLSDAIQARAQELGLSYAYLLILYAN